MSNIDSERMAFLSTGFFSILAAMAIYGLVHSVLASHTLKSWAAGVYGVNASRTWYRLFFNVIAVITLLPVLWLTATSPDQPLWSLPAPWSTVFRGIQVAGIAGAAIAVLQTGAMSFAGLQQLFTGGKEGESGAQVVKGLYRFVRHPIYTFSLMFLWFSPTFTVNSLAFALGASGYFLVGIFFEERKLSAEFGQKYLDYKSKTPALVPGLKFSSPTPLPVKTREDQ
jgi:methanethiol S-methyltransferase